MKRIQIISVSFVQHDGQPDQVHGAAQPLSAKLGKIKENSEVLLKTRRLGRPSQSSKANLQIED